MDDLRSLPDRVLRLYLGALAVWGFGLLGFYVAQNLFMALTLLYPLAIFVGLVTLWWGRQVMQRMESGDLARAEVDAGVRSVGRILAGSAALPAIVFLAHDPLNPASWGTCLSVGIVTAIAWFGVTGLVRLHNRYSNALALLLAWVALPLNATGAISMSFWFGWFELVQGTMG